MKTITLPVLVVAFILFAIVLSYKFIVNRRCRILRTALLQNCKKLFDTIGELRDLNEKIKKAEDATASCYTEQLNNLAERGRKITACLKNTIQDTL